MTSSRSRNEGKGSTASASDRTDRSASHLDLAPVYTNDTQRELPGEYPFTRGIHAGMYRDRLWTMRQYAGFGSPRWTNERFRYLLAQGQTGLSVAFDLPTQIGYDSDDPIALGEVGRVGVPISTLDDLDRLFEGIPLERVSISMTINSTAAILLALLIALARRRGLDPRVLRGTVQNDILKEFVARRTYRFPIAASMRAAVDVIEHCVRELPRFNPISVSGYHLREAGSNAVQEIGFALSHAIGYVEAARARGLDAAEVCARLTFFWAAHNDLFEEVAKFRAARRLWARLVRERFKVLDERAAKMRFHVQTAGSTLTFQEPENNAVRVAIQALAAVLGGTQSLHTNAIDEAASLPSPDTVRTALRTQQIIAYESGVTKVVDPLGGCPLIEDLTDRLEAEARKLIDAVDARGGALQAVASGFPQSVIEQESWRTQCAIEKGELPIVGVNVFADSPTESASSALDRASAREATDDADPQAIEAERARALEKHRRDRDDARVGRARAVLLARAREPGSILPALIECAESGVTLGEMMATLVEVWGEHHE